MSAESLSPEQLDHLKVQLEQHLNGLNPIVPENSTLLLKLPDSFPSGAKPLLNHRNGYRNDTVPLPAVRIGQAFSQRLQTILNQFVHQQNLPAAEAKALQALLIDNPAIDNPPHLVSVESDVPHLSIPNSTIEQPPHSKNSSQRPSTEYSPATSSPRLDASYFESPHQGEAKAIPSMTPNPITGNYSTESTTEKQAERISIEASQKNSAVTPLSATLASSEKASSSVQEHGLSLSQVLPNETSLSVPVSSPSLSTRHLPVGGSMQDLSGYKDLSKPPVLLDDDMVEDYAPVSTAKMTTPKLSAVSTEVLSRPQVFASDFADNHPDIDTEFSSNVRTLIRLVNDLPDGVTKQTGAQIIRLTMEAMGISMEEVLTEAQSAQSEMLDAVRANIKKIEEYKTVIRKLESDIKYYQGKANELSEIIDLFILSNTSPKVPNMDDMGHHG